MVAYKTQESNFDLTPSGTYTGEITSVEEYNSPNGKNKLIVKFVYADPETLEPKEHTEFVNPVISSGDGFRVFSDLMLCAGVMPEAEGSFDESKLVGVKCAFTVKHREYQGKTYANIAMVEPVTPSVKKN